MCKYHTLVMGWWIVEQGNSIRVHEKRTEDGRYGCKTVEMNQVWCGGGHVGGGKLDYHQPYEAK